MTFPENYTVLKQSKVLPGLASEATPGVLCSRVTRKTCQLSTIKSSSDPEPSGTS